MYNIYQLLDCTFNVYQLISIKNSLEKLNGHRQDLTEGLEIPVQWLLVPKQSWDHLVVITVMCKGNIIWMFSQLGI